jgi:hypothetical protein
MEKLTPSQRALLTILEEAGEESITALRNSGGTCRGFPNELESMGTALSDLINRDLLEIADSDDEASRRWVPWPKEKALAFLRDLESVVHWSAPEGIWKWRRGEIPLPYALLTDAGLAAARQVLSEEGYRTG